MAEIIFKSDWLKMNLNVHHDDLIEFVTEGEENKEGGWVFDVKINSTNPKSETGVIKHFQLNKTNLTATIKVYGKMTEDWVGQQMRVLSTKVRNPKTGEMVDGIVLASPEITLEE